MRWLLLKDLQILRRSPLLVALQIGLGLYVILSFRTVPSAVAHFAGAAALSVVMGTPRLEGRYCTGGRGILVDTPPAPAARSRSRRCCPR